MSPEDEAKLYQDAVQRYAFDETFRERVTNVKNMIMRSEHYTPTEGAQVGMWVGAAMALHLIDEGHAP